MSYQQMSDDFRGDAYRLRAEMCVREQGVIFASSPVGDIQALGRAVVSGNWADIEAVMAAVAVGPNGPAAVTDDGALLAGVQSVWPAVSIARYPGLAPE